MTFPTFIMVATLVLLIAKVTGAPDLSWWIVLAPLLLPVAGVLTLMGLGLLRMLWMWRPHS